LRCWLSTSSRACHGEARRECSADELEVAAAGGLKAGALGVELVAELGEAILGELLGCHVERSGEQLERAGTGVLLAAGQAGDVAVGQAAAARVEVARTLRERTVREPRVGRESAPNRPRWLDAR
jgi:hypothetical protein